MILSSSVTCVWHTCALLLTISTVLTKQQSLHRSMKKGMSTRSAEVRPKFLDSPQELQVPVGSDVSFPCDVDREDDSYKKIFKYVSTNGEDRIFYAGSTKVAHFPRVYKKGPSFILTDVQKADTGDYICRFETKPLTQIAHKLNVLYPPTVYRDSAEVQTVSQGSSVTLQCSADGNPSPTVSWIRHNGLLPSGAPTEEGFSLTLSDVNRHVEGTYECVANNGIGSSATKSMSVQVEYPPEITSEQSIIHTGEGDNAKLACVVYGRPSPEVTWTRGNAAVESDRHVMTRAGVVRHTLTIKYVTEEDFGEYTCKARNIMGSTKNVMELTGLAKTPSITSSPAGTKTTSYTLLIATETSAPLVKYRLRYRRIQSSSCQDHSASRKQEEYFPNNKNMNLIRQGVFQIKHNITRLQPGCSYNATVQVENKFGWSQHSTEFQFYTKREILTTTMSSLPQSFNHYPKVEEVAVGQPASGAIATVNTLAYCTLWMTLLKLSL